MIIVFDAQCLLCSRSVQFLLRHDKKGVFRFASIQGKTGAALLTNAGLSVDGLQTMVLCDDRRVWEQSAARLRVLHGRGWPSRLAWVAGLVPGAIAGWRVSCCRA